MAKNKICWITPDYFADCDIPYVPLLLRDFDIHWVVLLPNQSRYSEDDFLDLSKQADNLSVEIIRSKRRERNPLKVFEYLKINKIIKRECPDLIYINMVASSPWQIPMFLKLPKDNTIITAHQGRVHEGMGHYRYNNFLRDIVYGRLKNVNMFSKSQAGYFIERYCDSIIYQIPLGLKFFGASTIDRPKADNCVRFLMFGLIVKNKNLSLLVDAVNRLYDKGIRDIKVVIRGKGVAAEELKSHFKYLDIIDAEFRYVENSEIPNLFNACHYLVQPYKEMSQSGPFKVAMQYNLPLITSDLPGFTDEMSEGETGFVFKNDDIDDLEKIVLKCYRLAKNENEYALLRQKMNSYVSANYSSESIVNAYKEMFKNVIDHA